MFELVASWVCDPVSICISFSIPFLEGKENLISLNPFLLLVVFWSSQYLLRFLSYYSINFSNILLANYLLGLLCSWLFWVPGCPPKWETVIDAKTKAFILSYDTTTTPIFQGLSPTLQYKYTVSQKNKKLKLSSRFISSIKWHFRLTYLCETVVYTAYHCFHISTTLTAYRSGP